MNAQCRKFLGPSAWLSLRTLCPCPVMRIPASKSCSKQRQRCNERLTCQARLGEDDRHVVSAPDLPGDEQHLPNVLLILLPGAYMKCEAYDGLLNRLKEVDIKAPDVMEQATARVNACVDVMLEQSQAQGFSADLIPSGRCTNMLVMAHSSAALFGAPLTARRAGALILLGSYFFPSPDYHASLYEWSRSYLPSAVPFAIPLPAEEACDASRSASLSQALAKIQGRPARQAQITAMIRESLSTGLRYAARNQPVILLPGVNHSHLTNAEIREGSGDLSAEVSLAEANDAAGGAAADFITANFSPSRPIQNAAIERLQQECIRTAEWLAPYTRALGMSIRKNA